MSMSDDQDGVVAGIAEASGEIYGGPETSWRGRREEIETSSSVSLGSDGSNLDDWSVVDRLLFNGSVQDGRSNEPQFGLLEKGDQYVGRHAGHSKDERLYLRSFIVGGFRNVPPRRRVVHEIVYGNSSADAATLMENALQEVFRGSVFIVARHGEHWHIIHDCSYSNGSCRCLRAESIKAAFGQKRSVRRTVRTADYTIQHWLNLADYLQGDGRSIDHFEIAGRTWIQRGKAGGIQFRRSEESRAVGMVEDEVYADAISDFLGCGPSGGGGSIGSARSDASDTGSGGTREEGKKSKIESAIRSVLTSPISHIFNMRSWLTGRYKLMNPSKDYIQLTIRSIAFTFNEMTIRELFLYARAMDPTKLVYSAPSEDYENYYYDMSTSVYIMEELLTWQYGIDGVAEFLQDLLQILDKTIPKKNTIHIIGEPCSGKNYFFDAVTSFCVSVGNIGNFTKYNTFPLMDCVARRVLMWNEPALEESSLETLKLVFGGDSCPIRVKYQGDSIMTRTPVIVLSNNKCLPTTPAFTCRVSTHRWITCDHLKKASKKPHPLAFGYLLIKYKLMENIVLEEQEEKIFQ